MTTTVKAIHKEVGDMFGQVPNWMRELPESALSGFWTSMRDFHLAETVLPNKTKELIGIAVAGAIRCRYCTLFHTEAARLFGATDAEIAEAAAMAGQTMSEASAMACLEADGLVRPGPGGARTRRTSSRPPANNCGPVRARNPAANLAPPELPRGGRDSPRCSAIANACSGSPSLLAPWHASYALRTWPSPAWPQRASQRDVPLSCAAPALPSSNASPHRARRPPRP